VNSTKNLHYWMVESMGDPANDPVAFWTNGGPGCSGLLGALTEMGPFRPSKDLSLQFNEYSWNTIANMVFIEAPCGVGFSYSDEPDGDDYTTDDAQTAKDNYAMIQAFFERFPEYRSNDLYLTSESYGGHYLPTLSKEIVDHNTAGDQPTLNFKGFAVGNPATTFYSAIPAGMETYWGHQVISQPLYDQFTDKCKSVKRDWEACEEIYLAMYAEAGGLNPYALDYPVCTDDARKLARAGRSQRTWLLNQLLPGLPHYLKQQATEVQTANTTRSGLSLSAFAAQQGSLSAEESEAAERMLASVRKQLQLQPVADYEPCEEDYMTAYLSQSSVKQALHVKEDIEWKDCSYTLRYKQSDGWNDMTEYYNYLIDGDFGLNILVYSGDDDDVCATVGTQSWIWGLGYEVAGRKWQTWTVDEQTAGYLTKWKGTKLAFATVRGAGHEVPTYKPAEALSLFKSYLAGELTDA